MSHPRSMSLLQECNANSIKSIFTAVVLVSALCNPVFAQETTSAVRGMVSDLNGKPISGSTVIVRNEETGLTRTITTNASGEFSIRNLPVGDDYSVAVTSTGYSGRKTENLPLSLGQIYLPTLRHPDRSRRRRPLLGRQPECLVIQQLFRQQRASVRPARSLLWLHRRLQTGIRFMLPFASRVLS